MARRNTTLDFIALAAKYGDLSNKHDLHAIRAMLHADAVCYGFKGKDKIIEGMTDFRRQHDRVNWIFPNGFHEIASTDDSTVRIEFLLRREWFVSGKGVQCEATEFIDFCSHEGLIKHIGYTKDPTIPIDAPHAKNTAHLYNKFIDAVKNPKWIPGVQIVSTDAKNDDSDSTAMIRENYMIEKHSC